MATNPRIVTPVTAGKKFDIDFVNWTDGVQGEAQFTFGTLSKKTTGLIKVTNRFIKILLTRKGSDPFNLDRGTFFDDLQYMGGDSTQNIGTFAAEQLKQAHSQILEIQSDNAFPEDENINKVSLLKVIRPSQDKVQFQVQIITEAGEGANIMIPIIGG